MQFHRSTLIFFIALIGLPSFSVFTGCEQSSVESQTAAVTVSNEDIAPEGSINCPIVCVSEIAKDANAHAGRVAVRGVVSKVYKDRRAFTVANIVEGASCCPSGCGHDTVPVRVPAGEYVGDLPGEFERVIVVGEVVPNGDGYDFIIEEVWAAGKVVLKKQV